MSDSPERHSVVDMPGDAEAGTKVSWYWQMLLAPLEACIATWLHLKHSCWFTIQGSVHAVATSCDCTETRAAGNKLKVELLPANEQHLHRTPRRQHTWRSCACRAARTAHRHWPRWRTRRRSSTETRTERPLASQTTWSHRLTGPQVQPCLSPLNSSGMGWLCLKSNQLAVCLCRQSASALLHSVSSPDTALLAKLA